VAALNAEYVVAEWIALAFHHAIPNTNPQTFGPNTMRLAESLLTRLREREFEVWPSRCPQCDRFWSPECAVDGDIEPLLDGRRQFDGPSLMERHQRHYQSCNCLGDKAICCDPTCPCHEPAQRDGSGCGE
jgi:hypothetical protein